jgi:hypothetical protein
LAAHAGDHEKTGVAVAFVTVTVRLPSHAGRPDAVAVLELQPHATAPTSMQIADARLVFIRAVVGGRMIHRMYPEDRGWFHARTHSQRLTSQTDSFERMAEAPVP